MIKVRRRNGGMTLIEILVATALFALFTLTLTQLLMGGMRTYKRGQAISTLRNDLRLAMETISNDVRTAKKFNDGWGQGVKSLQFSLQTNKQNLNDPSSVGDEVTISYVLDAANGMLIRTQGASKTLLARDLVVSSTPNSSESYFKLVHSESQENNPGMEVEIRLSALRYVGTDEQRMSMVTHASASGTFASTYTRNPIDMIPEIRIGDIKQPHLVRFGR